MNEKRLNESWLGQERGKAPIGQVHQLWASSANAILVTPAPLDAVLDEV